MDSGYGDFRRVIRGHDPRRAGPSDDPHRLTLDGGAGFGGELLAACLDPEGHAIELLRA